ncbi:MAG TPA: hypothetical protein VGF01_16510 [Terracidiphilus sp.]|jgi:mannose-6-phosphate isomerase-like protein (cupin superfamily)
MKLAMKLAVAGAICALAASGWAQSAAQAGSTSRADTPPASNTNSVNSPAAVPPPVFAVNDVPSQLAVMAAKAKAAGNSSGSTLVDYGSYKLQLSVRTTNGGAEIHAHFDDVMIVEQGSATLITGGTVVDAKTGPDGETRGSKIIDGTSRTLAAGDMVTIRAGTPHQLLIAPGTAYSAVVVKIRE